MDDLFEDAANSAIYDRNQIESMDGDEEIEQEDAWVVITKYFDEKGLVRQQLDSFDGFITNTIQAKIDCSSELLLILTLLRS